MDFPLQQWMLNSGVDKREAVRNNPDAEKGNKRRGWGEGSVSKILAAQA